MIHLLFDGPVAWWFLTAAAINVARQATPHNDSEPAPVEGKPARKRHNPPRKRDAA